MAGDLPSVARRLGRVRDLGHGASGFHGREMCKQRDAAASLGMPREAERV